MFILKLFSLFGLLIKLNKTSCVLVILDFLEIVFYFENSKRRDRRMEDSNMV